MTRRASWMNRTVCAGVAIATAIALTMLDPNLAVRTVVDGLDLPIGLAFLAPGDMLVLEKDTGKIKRVTDGGVTATVLDLGVNNSSERGLLGIALHPDFPANPGVYVFWTFRSTALTADPLVPDEQRCHDAPAEHVFSFDPVSLEGSPLRGVAVER